MAAASVLELLFVLGLAATLSAMAIPTIGTSLDEMRTVAAARYLAARLQQARMEAVRRTRSTAVRFTGEGPSSAYVVYVDGNRNGVLTSDIADEIDRQIGPVERLPDQFPGITFGVLAGLARVDEDGGGIVTDPVAFGRGSLATFSSNGTSSTGSLYVRGPGTAQCVIRLFGHTGKTRVLKFNPRSRSWIPM
jgi:type II secretory pathway pseudopilin PulG